MVLGILSYKKENDQACIHSLVSNCEPNMTSGFKLPLP